MDISTAVGVGVVLEMVNVRFQANGLKLNVSRSGQDALKNHTKKTLPRLVSSESNSFTFWAEAIEKNRCALRAPGCFSF